MRNRLASRALVGTVAVALALLLTACYGSGQQSVANEMNADRRSKGRSTLPMHATLNAKAQAWAEKMARDNALSHSSLSAGAPSCWRSLGENVGYGSSVSRIQDAYMASSGHRANILNTKWNWVGTGYATRGSRVFTVQVFMMGC